MAVREVQVVHRAVSGVFRGFGGIAVDDTLPNAVADQDWTSLQSQYCGFVSSLILAANSAMTNLGWNAYVSHWLASPLRVLG